MITQIRLEHDVNIQFPDKDDGSQVGGQGPALLWPGGVSLPGSSQFLLLSSAQMFIVVLRSLALWRVLLRVIVFFPVLRGMASSWSFLSPPFCFESSLSLLVFSGLASHVG